MKDLDKYILKEQVPWDYILYEKDENYILEIICGSSAYYSIYIRLTSEEILQYSTEGRQALENISAGIRDNLEDQRRRAI